MTVYGYGVCVDDIKTTPQKLLKLASMKPNVLEDVEEHLNNLYNGNYKVENLSLDDFVTLEGNYCEHGAAYILFQLIDEFDVEYVEDCNNKAYILYIPTYPWCMKKEEKMLTEEDVYKVFKKYVEVLTDEFKIDYHEMID